MSLEIKRTFNIVGTSKIDGVVAVRYSASIDSQNPSSINYVPIIQNKDLYKDNRDICHEDQAEFENVMYEMQDDIITRYADINNTDDLKDDMYETDIPEIAGEYVINNMEDTTDENDDE